MDGAVYKFLGLSVGVVVHGLEDEERKEAYGCDVTYGTNNEFGFDYLRDNMKYSLDEFVQREFNYGIVDEVDSILIDEARTPSSYRALPKSRPTSITRSTGSSTSSERTPISRSTKRPRARTSRKRAWRI